MRSKQRHCSNRAQILGSKSRYLLLHCWDEHPLHPVCDLFPERCLLRLGLQRADRCNFRAKLRTGTIGKGCVAVRDAIRGRLPNRKQG